MLDYGKYTFEFCLILLFMKTIISSLKTRNHIGGSAIGGHSFSTYGKFPEKLTFLTP